MFLFRRVLCVVVLVDTFSCFKYLAASLLLLGTTVVNAEDTDINYLFGLEIGQVALNTEYAESHGTDTVGRSWIRLHTGLEFYQYGLIDVGFGIFNIGDKDPFYQSVSNPNLPFANSYYETSKLVSGEFYVAIGALYPISERYRIGALAGTSEFSITRTIKGCSNCVREKLEVEAGSYIELRAARYSPTQNNITGNFYLSYRKFIGNSDVENMAYLGFSVAKPF